MQCFSYISGGKIRFAERQLHFGRGLCSLRQAGWYRPEEGRCWRVCRVGRRKWKSKRSSWVSVIHFVCYCSRTETAHFIRSSDVFGSNTLLNRSRELSVFLSPTCLCLYFPFYSPPPPPPPSFLQLHSSQLYQTGSAAVGRGKQIPVKTSERGKIRSAQHKTTSDPSTVWLAVWTGEARVEQTWEAHGARWGMLGRHPILGAFTPEAGWLTPLACTSTAQNKSIFMSCCHHIGQNTHLCLDVPDSTLLQDS